MQVNILHGLSQILHTFVARRYRSSANSYQAVIGHNLYNQLSGPFATPNFTTPMLATIWVLPFHGVQLLSSKRMMFGSVCVKSCADKIISLSLQIQNLFIPFHLNLPKGIEKDKFSKHHRGVIKLSILWDQTTQKVWWFWKISLTIVYCLGWCHIMTLAPYVFLGVEEPPCLYQALREASRSHSSLVAPLIAQSGQTQWGQGTAQKK